MSVSEADVLALYQRVRSLRLRIQKMPQVTPWINEEADRLAAPLMAIEKKLNRHLQHPPQLIYMHDELVRVQGELQALFRDHLNPLIGRSSD
ncbi:hypothetical protein [Deinococcus sp. QL22]|uniref:hypothetical protein n=1 Tax=Deinococcus sp. QL22 TaxID=2939437 RepID=UPI002018203C|nr:hypothetical protein [Deinococcus sp. QL22]UQN10556.1 hypothetical protein M1R55_30610 [Deinococcus sp. QL22]